MGVTVPVFVARCNTLYKVTRTVSIRTITFNRKNRVDSESCGSISGRDQGAERGADVGETGAFAFLQQALDIGQRHVFVERLQHGRCCRVDVDGCATGQGGDVRFQDSK